MLFREKSDGKIFNLAQHLQSKYIYWLQRICIEMCYIMKCNCNRRLLTKLHRKPVNQCVGAAFLRSRSAFSKMGRIRTRGGLRYPGSTAIHKDIIIIMIYILFFGGGIYVFCRERNCRKKVLKMVFYDFTF